MMKFQTPPTATTISISNSHNNSSLLTSFTSNTNNTPTPMSSSTLTSGAFTTDYVALALAAKENNDGLTVSTSTSKYNQRPALEAILATPTLVEVKTDEEKELVAKFEKSWKTFLIETNPDLAPQSKRLDRLEEMHRIVMETYRSKHAVESEMTKQLEFFQSSRERLEAEFESEIHAANSKQKDVVDDLQTQLDNIAVNAHALKRDLPWNLFLERVQQKTQQYAAATKTTSPVATATKEAEAEATAIEANNKTTVTTPNKNSGAKPSMRALALVEDGAEEDKNLRAHRLDHALLTAQVKLLEQQVETIEQWSESMSFLGNFLMEHNIWSIIGGKDEVSDTGILAEEEGFEQTLQQ